LSSAKIASATLISRVLGLVREQAMAHYFGATGLTDAFLVAYRIPNILRDLFAEGAFSSAFVPVFTEESEKDPKAARTLLWNLFLLLGGVTLVFCGLIMIFSPQLIAAIAPRFADNPVQLELTIGLTRFMAPFLVFISIAALFMGALNSVGVFFIPSLAPAFFNVVMICSIIFLPPVMRSMGHNPSYALGFGVFCGGVIQLLIQIPLLYKKGYAPKIKRPLLGHAEKKVFKKLGPGLVGFAATQVNVLINTMLATGAGVGAVSWLAYAFRLFQFPVGILGVSIANSNLVHFGRFWKKGEEDNAKDVLVEGFYYSLLTISLATMLLCALSHQSAHLIFQRGLFNITDSIQTGKALFYYALGLPFYGLYKIITPTFYVLDKQQIPVRCSILGVIFNVVFCVALTPHYGFVILAIGTSLAITLNACIQLVLLKKELNLPLASLLSLRNAKVIASAFLSFPVAFYLSKYLYIFEDSLLERALGFVVCAGAATGCYMALLFLFGEGRGITQWIKNKINKN
jgi:putative peptidoglycan lipid II flippase